MDRPTVYIETSVASYLAARPSRDPVTARNQQLTRDWWNTRRHDYELYASTHVLREARRGDLSLAPARLALLSALPVLPVTSGTRALADVLVERIPLPKHAEADALHIAIGAVQEMDYLVTWDRRHIANPRLEARIGRVCATWGTACRFYARPRSFSENEAMCEDPIVAEVHRIRREIMAEFDGDMDAFYQDLKNLEQEERMRGRVIVDFSRRDRAKPDAA